MLQALQKTVEVKSIYEKKRFDTKGQYVEDDDFVLGEQSQFPLLVKENGVRFAVYLNDGAMVGVFLDQRDVGRPFEINIVKASMCSICFLTQVPFLYLRPWVERQKTTSVDLANRSLPKTEEQFRSIPLILKSTILWSWMCLTTLNMRLRRI